MKRTLLTLAGLVSLLAAGCCCDGCNWCQSCCCSPCASACPPSCAATPTAYYSPYGGAPATAAAIPVESLPTY
ncbi:MAG TPA: hypothetical protein VL475_11225 [Planctomycetaceae bacterium]|nr:hypothetical protein [Planctomycetaceae bacterium]